MNSATLGQNKQKTKQVNFCQESEAKKNINIIIIICASRALMLFVQMFSTKAVENSCLARQPSGKSVFKAVHGMCLIGIVLGGLVSCNVDKTQTQTKAVFFSCFSFTFIANLRGNGSWWKINKSPAAYHRFWRGWVGVTQSVSHQRTLYFNPSSLRLFFLSIPLSNSGKHNETDSERHNAVNLMLIQQQQTSK